MMPTALAHQMSPKSVKTTLWSAIQVNRLYGELKKAVSWFELAEDCKR